MRCFTLCVQSIITLAEIAYERLAALQLNCRLHLVSAHVATVGSAVHGHQSGDISPAFTWGRTMYRLWLCVPRPTIQLECSTLENPLRGRGFARICLSCRLLVEFPTRPTMVSTYIYMIASHTRLALHRPPPSYVSQAHKNGQTKRSFNTYRC